ncbi:hypothetical protein JCM10450v2_004428 [Rhodotorula kratochvilovae]
MEPFPEDPRAPSAPFDTLPDELVLDILQRAYPPVHIPEYRARRDPEDSNAEIARCAALARLSRVSKRWSVLADAVSDVFLRFDEAPLQVRRRTGIINKVIIEIDCEQLQDIDLPDWLPPLVAPGAATLVLGTAVEQGFPAHSPAWDTLRRCEFNELVYNASNELVLGRAMPAECTRDVFRSARRLRFGNRSSAPFLAGCPWPLTTIQVTPTLGTLRGLSRRPELRSLHIVGHSWGGFALAYPAGERPAFAGQLTSLTWDMGDSKAFAAVFLHAHSLQRLDVGRDTLTDVLLAHLPSLRDLAFLRLVRHADTPAHAHDPRYWTFDALAAQVALLLAQPDRTAHRLVVEVVVEGTLRKYDVAQRSAREEFRKATSRLAAAQAAGLEVLLFRHEDERPRAWRAFPRQDAA